MKRGLTLLLALMAILALLIVGCSGGSSTAPSGQTGGDQQQPAEGEQQGGNDSASDEITLPDQLTISTYDVGSAGYAQLTAIADAITREFGTKIRLMPSASGVGRLLPLRDGTAQIGGRLGDEVYFAFEGIEEFASPQWGPQNVRYIYPIWNHFGALVLADSPYQTLADLKGAKWPHVIGNPSVNVKVEALLASAGLTLDDVEIVEITSYASQPNMVAQGQIDVALIVPDAASVYEAHEMYGMRWIDLKHLEEDPEALARLREVYPFGAPVPWDLGGALERGNPVTFMGYTTYSPAVYADADPDLVYNFLRALEATYDMYKDATPNMFIWHWEQTIPEPLGVPLHEGAVRYFKEKGMWTDEYERRNQELIERFELLRQAWEETVAEASAQGISESDFPAFWLERRPK